MSATVDSVGTASANQCHHVGHFATRRPGQPAAALPPLCRQECLANAHTVFTAPPVPVPLCGEQNRPCRTQRDLPVAVVNTGDASLRAALGFGDVWAHGGHAPAARTRSSTNMRVSVRALSARPVAWPWWPAESMLSVSSAFRLLPSPAQALPSHATAFGYARRVQGECGAGGGFHKARGAGGGAQGPAHPARRHAAQLAGAVVG